MHTCQMYTCSKRERMNVTERMVGIAPCSRVQHKEAGVTCVPQCFSTFLGSVTEYICHVPIANSDLLFTFLNYGHVLQYFI